MGRWDSGITHNREAADQFISDYFGGKTTPVLFIGAAGFDCRSTSLMSELAKAGVPMRGVLIREERPNAQQSLIQRGDDNEACMKQIATSSTTLHINMFDPQDGAVTGGKTLAKEVSQLLAGEETDICIDLTALSIGLAFPLARVIHDWNRELSEPKELHIFITSSIDIDLTVSSEHAESCQYLPGFDGEALLDSTKDATRLWIPQLVEGRVEVLRRITSFVKPDEICPVLPFPSGSLRRGDNLIKEYQSELGSFWPGGGNDNDFEISVDPRSFIYASDEDPLDFYRTLVRVRDRRLKVYGGYGGSLVILSPIGSKVLSLGALLAAIEYNLPVAYLETQAYSIDGDLDHAIDPATLVHHHLWFDGKPYK